MNRKHWFGLIVFVVLLDLFVANVMAGKNDPATPSPVPLAQTRSNGKLSFRLEALARSAQLRAAPVAEQARTLSLPAQGAGSLMRDAQGRLLIYIRMSDLSTTQLQTLRTTGAQIVHVSNEYRVVTALVAANALTALELIAVVQSVTEALAPNTGNISHPIESARLNLNKPAACPQGANFSEGDTQLNAALARSIYGIDGTGVVVGVLSDSYDLSASAVTRAITDVLSGDLPGVGNPCGHLTAVSVISESIFTGNAIDEGRAMLQIVHDLAPGATLKFATADHGMYAFASNVTALRAAGANILVDDISYPGDPLYQDGPVGVAISNAVGSGALHFSSAGNKNIIIGGNNVSSYEAPAYRPTACPTGLPVGAGPDCHDFDPGGGVSNSSAITLVNGGKLNLEVQWSEPWFGVSTDFDVFLLSITNTVVAGSTYDNATTGLPHEYFSFTNNSGSTQQYRIVINRYTGSSTPRIKYILYNGTAGVSAVQYNSSSGGDIVGPTLMGRAASQFAFSVAAAPYFDSTTPETYSSRGPAAHYWGPVEGITPASAIVPVIIQQPDFAATDGGCTTFFSVPPGTCYRFYGTSAAAPHAAGVAALLKQKANQLNMPLTRGWAKFILQSTASSMSGGNINSVGAGLLDTNAAVAKLIGSKFLFLPLIVR